MDFVSSSLIDTEEGRKTLQQALIDHGFDCGPDGADGVLGGDSAKAIIAARVHYNLPNQDKAVYDVALERSLGLLAVQSPEVQTAATSLIPFILQLVLKGGPNVTDIPSIAGWLNNSTILGFLRNLLISGGGVLTTSGVFTGTQWEQIVGAIIVIVSGILSFIANKKAADAKAIAKAVDAHPDLTVVPKSDGTAAIAVSK